MKTVRLHDWIVVGIFSSVLLGGCAGSTPAATLTPLPTHTLPPTPTQTRTPTFTPTATATYTPTATHTPRPSATPTQAPTETPTLAPTVGVIVDRKGRVDGLTVTNNSGSDVAIELTSADRSYFYITIPSGATRTFSVQNGSYQGEIYMCGQTRPLGPLTISGYTRFVIPPCQ